jgi:hypothetical protein
VQQVEWVIVRGRPMRRSPRIAYEQLRAAEVDQGFFQLLLNIGTVRVTAGATIGGASELVLYHVSRPRSLQAELLRRSREVLLQVAAHDGRANARR